MRNVTGQVAAEAANVQTEKHVFSTKFMRQLTLNTHKTYLYSVLSSWLLFFYLKEEFVSIRQEYWLMFV